MAIVADERLTDVTHVQHLPRGVDLGQRMPRMANQLKRDRTRCTVTACHLPPAGVGTPRALSSAAIFRADNPASSANTGRNCSARSSASSRLLMPPALSPPSLTPWAFFPAKASLVR